MFLVVPLTLALRYATLPGGFAVEALLAEASCKGKARLSVLTHCNTGERGPAGREREGRGGVGGDAATES